MRTYALEAIRRITSIYMTNSAGTPDERIERKEFDKEIDGALDDVFG